MNIVLFLILLTSAADAGKPKKPFCGVRGDASVEMKYLAHSALVQLEAKQAALEMREPMSAPANGIVIVDLKSITIENGNTDLLTFGVVNGSEILGRQQGQHDIADVPQPTVPVWTNRAVFIVPDGVVPPFVVRVTHARAGIVCDATLNINGTFAKTDYASK